MGDPVEHFASAERAVNARRITAALVALTVLGTAATVVFSAPISTIVWMVGTLAMMSLAYALARASRGAQGILLAVVATLVQHVGIVASERSLGPVPFIAPVVVLLVAAAAPSRWLSFAFVAALAAIFVEGALSPLAPDDQARIIGATLILGVVFAVSLLHIRSNQRAFELAEAQWRDRQRATEAAGESERRYQLIADHTDDLIALISRTGDALYLSPSHERLFGIRTEDALGKPPHEVMRVENLNDAGIAFSKALESGEAQLELRMRDSKGGLRQLDTVMKRVESAGSTYVTSISRDVTERKQLEARLLASERLEVLGRLAGGVAHDFNNLLTVIGGAAELTRTTLPPDHRALRELDTLAGAVGSAGRLTRELLTFSRKQLVVPTKLHLTTAMEEQRTLLERMVGDRVKIAYAFDADVPPVFIASAHWEQLTMNLAINARDAMREGGCLTFRLRLRTLAHGELPELATGRYVELEVEDEGSGVPVEALPHLFDPLFTTKGEGGTGLGLATCSNIVTQAGGAISVHPNPTRGTTFRVLLPATGISEAPVDVARPHAPAVQVLVVDDEEAVRTTTARLLQASGREVRMAASFEEALSVIENSELKLDAIVTDVVLGDRRGTELLQRARQLRPDVGIVVMSGYTPDPAAARLLVDTGARFLSKPFTRDELLRAIAQA